MSPPLFKIMNCPLNRGTSGGCSVYFGAYLLVWGILENHIFRSKDQMKAILIDKGRLEAVHTFWRTRGTYINFESGDLCNSVTMRMPVTCVTKLLSLAMLNHTNIINNCNMKCSSWQVLTMPNSVNLSTRVLGDTMWKLMHELLTRKGGNVPRWTKLTFELLRMNLPATLATSTATAAAASAGVSQKQFWPTAERTRMLTLLSFYGSKRPRVQLA